MKFNFRKQKKKQRQKDKKSKGTFFQKDSQKSKKQEKKPLQHQKSNQITITGKISVTGKGYGFVIPEKGFDEDIFIPKKYMKGAADGDLVKVLLSDSFSSKGPEGKIISIVKRERSVLVGIVIAKEKEGYLAFIPLLGKSKPAKVTSEQKLNIGERILIKIKNWKGENEPLDGSLEKSLGNLNDASMDVQATAVEFNLSEHFSKEACQEAKAFTSQKIEEEIAHRKDFTNLNAITIDPESAKDFDDAVSLSKNEKGHFYLGVHIADAAFFVKPASFLDEEALKRCNSTYFPGRCLSMLPKELSDNLCSLKPDVPRLTVSVMMEFDHEGKLLHYDIQRSVIKSKKRFTYEEALAVIENKQPSPFEKQLKEMIELCLLFKKQRFARGSIEFSLPSAQVIIDEKGEPQGIKIVEYDISHQMIEEFMLKANEVVATHLKKQGKTLIFRIHEQPDADGFDDFFALAKSLGFVLSKKPNLAEIQKLFAEADKKEPAILHQLSVSFIRSMKLALYSTENLGHYGLGLENYCHFTSPIRRYSDLIIARLLFNEEGKTDLAAVSEKCSLAERKSFKAEMSVVNLKKLRLLKKLYQKEPNRTYTAVVTKIKPYYLFFEISDFFFEGSLHLSELDDDFYVYDPDKIALKGSHTKRFFMAGDKIEIKIKKINFLFLEIEWSLI